jgi:outer membrane lipoprotein carrier protein
LRGWRGRFTEAIHARCNLWPLSASKVSRGRRQPANPTNLEFNMTSVSNPPASHRRFRRDVCRIAAGMLLAMFSIASSAQNTSAEGLNALENFVKSTKSGRAAFTQVVTSPARDGQAAKTKTSSGSFEFLRPNRFRFVYKKPFEQTIVADGQTLWLHDVDLNQVTQRKLSQVLSGTPAVVIAAAADLKSLEADFTLTPLPDKAGLRWVQAKPRTSEGQLQSISVGFRQSDKGLELAQLEILDSFGQNSVMTFTGFETNPALGAASFNFTPPPKADVIRQ